MTPNKKMLKMIQNDCNEATVQAIPLLSKLKGETILITGGTGFMGTWIAEMIAFLNDTYKFNTSMILLSDRAKKFNEKAHHLVKRKDIELIEQDVRLLNEIPENVGYILHAAATPDNRLHASDPIRTMQVISRGTDSVLHATTKLQNLKKIVNVSSGLIYGPQPPDLIAIPENFRGGPDCDSVASVYAETKRFAETICSAYRSQYKLPIVNVRPFAFIGPYQLLDKPWAINNFIRDSLMGGQIRILGDGETIRSYMYASDMAFWLLRMLIDGTPGQSYNLGNPNGLTLNQLAEKIAGNFPIKPRIISNMVNAGNLQHSRFVPDITLAQKTIGLTPKIDIDEAIKRTLVWYKEME